MLEPAHVSQTAYTHAVSVCILLGGSAYILPIIILHMCLLFQACSILFLQVLQKLPVSIDALKQGNMGKIVKQLSRQENAGN